VQYRKPNFCLTGGYGNRLMEETLKSGEDDNAMGDGYFHVICGKTGD
jgi:hypothetical protein